jgi:hypothetical protein
MPTRNYRGDVVSGSFRKLKFPFIIEHMALYSNRYSENVGIKFFRKFGDDHYPGEKRTFVQAFVISRHGLTLNHIYLSRYFEIEVIDRSGTLKITGIDMV